MSLRSMTHYSFLMVLFVLCGCAGFSGGALHGSDGVASDGPMTQGRMELLFADQVEAIMGPPGAIQTRIDGINVYLISDPQKLVAVFLKTRQRLLYDPRFAGSESFGPPPSSCRFLNL